MNQALFGINEAAKILSLSPWTIRDWVRHGKLASVKLGRRVLIEPVEWTASSQVEGATMAKNFALRAIRNARLEGGDWELVYNDQNQLVGFRAVGTNCSDVRRRPPR